MLKLDGWGTCLRAWALNLVLISLTFHVHAGEDSNREDSCLFGNFSSLIGEHFEEDGFLRCLE